MRFNPAFEDRPDEAMIIARILGGYGELEFLLAVCLGNVLGDTKKALRVFFRTRGETARIATADALAVDDYANAGFKAPYADALGAMRGALKLRNAFAHSHWVALNVEPYNVHGLFYVALGESALPSESFTYEWMHAEINLLKQMEGYCAYARQALMYLDAEWQAKRSGKPNLVVPKAKKRQPPTPRIVVDPNTLKWLPKSL